MELLFDVSKLCQTKVHDMDWGSVSGTISCEDHTMEINPWWENCGQTGEDLTCSCGFRSQEKHGGGCHMHPYANQDHTLDELHREMYDAARAWQHTQPRIENATSEAASTNEELVEKLCDAVAEAMQLEYVYYSDEDVARRESLYNEIIPELRAQILERMIVAD